MGIRVVPAMALKHTETLKLITRDVQVGLAEVWPYNMLDSGCVVHDMHIV